jgi:hypothetical protein
MVVSNLENTNSTIEKVVSVEIAPTTKNISKKVLN